MDLVSLVPSSGGLLFTVAAFVVALLIIVAVHEFGHYIVGRWSGIHAEVFSLGFGPVLLSRRDRRGTRWQIAALPFGGYVKFLGDSDAASGKDGDSIAALSPDERRHTMHGAPLWARAATVAAGPLSNFVFSIAVFTAVVIAQGVATEAPVVGRIHALPAAFTPDPAAGPVLQAGDRIVAVAGHETPDLAAFGAVLDTLPATPLLSYDVLRDGQEVTVRGPQALPPRVAGVQPRSAAFEAGLREGDVVTAIAGRPVYAFRTLRETVGASDGATQDLTIWRDGSETAVELRPRRADLPLPDGGFETRWLIGLSGSTAFEPQLRTPGPIEALGFGAVQTWDIARTSISGLGHMLTGAISTCNLSGPIGIAETSGAMAAQGTADFIWFLALLSTAVGLLNLFPIPVLDGGHLVFHAWEAVAGKPPSDRALRVLMTAGLTVLLSLMVFALSNDIFCP